LVVARLVTAGSIVVVGVGAWSIPGIHMVQALPLLTAVAIVNAVVIARLRDSTRIVDADALSG
jgi:hypothetical protein